MLGTARQATPRPAAAVDLAQLPAIGAEAITAVAAREAEYGGKQRRIASMQQRHQGKGSARVGGDILDRGEAWALTVEAEK
jgi:hypothetical protein